MRRACSTNEASEEEYIWDIGGKVRRKEATEIVKM
jgi:hypothetical protein